MMNLCGQPAGRRANTLFKLAALALSAAVASGGNGSFRNGVYNFCVAVLFDATPAQLANIQASFTNGNKVWADALDGQQRFGTITIVNNCTVANKCGSLELAEFWILPGNGRNYATYSQYGVRNSTSCSTIAGPPAAVRATRTSSRRRA